MDLRVYYQKLRETEADIESDPVLIFSLDTPDGGRAGVVAEVARSVAARMIVDRRARLATDDEATAFRAEAERSLALVQQETNARRMQFTVISDAELRRLREARTGKG